MFSPFPFISSIVQLLGLTSDTCNKQAAASYVTFRIIRFVSGKIIRTYGQPSRPEYCDSKHFV
jgi:hypothetical protein